jgi:hypothetical protein
MGTTVLTVFGWGGGGGFCSSRCCDTWYVLQQTLASA